MTEEFKEQVKNIVEHLDVTPFHIHFDDFAPLKAWAEKNGASFPPVNSPHYKPDGTSSAAKKSHSVDPNAIDPEHDPDPDRWECLLDAQVTYSEVTATEDGDDAALEKAAELKSGAQELAAEGELDKALEKMSEALKLKPTSAMYWAYRATLYLKKKATSSALKDAEKALELNPESARALRARGTAHRHLGHFEQAADDLNHANQCDYDDSTVELAKFCTERASVIRQTRWHKQQEEAERKEKERLQELRAEQLREHQRRQAQEAEEEAAAAAAAASNQQQGGGNPFAGMGGMGGGMPGGMGGMPNMGRGGGMPGAGAGGMPAGMAGMMDDPEIQEALKDPETAQKLQTMMSNPMAAMQYMSDPKVGPILQKMMSGMMGGGGMPGMGGGRGGGMPGGMGGRGGGMPPNMANMFGGMNAGAGDAPDAEEPEEESKPSPGVDLD